MSPSRTAWSTASPPPPARANASMAQAFGLDDPVPVTCEPFRQWVLEDNFPQGRPALEKVGVT
jgi:mannitol 2-dehydrogenase